MKANRGLGADYVTMFDRIYPDLTDQYGALLYPFFLEVSRSIRRSISRTCATPMPRESRSSWLS